jgi:GPH family glycoside/pentoside/hexuronide:cation symporter
MASLSEFRESAALAKRDANPTRPEDRVPPGQKMALGIGGFPFFTGGAAVQYIAQPIFQIVLGMSPLLFGLAMTIPRVIDAFTDPVMGAISDNFRSRWGRRRPFILAGALLSGVCFAAIWFVPRGVGGTGAFVYLLVTTLLFFSAFTVFSIPLTSLSYEMTPDYHERTRVMTFWSFFVTAGNLAINWYAPATHWEIFGDPLTGARWVGVIIGVFVFAGLGALPAIFTRERFYAKTQMQAKVTFWTAVRQAGSSRPMLMLVCLLLALNFCGTIAGSLAQYIVIYHVCAGNVKAGLFLNSLNGTGFAVVGFAFIPVIAWLSRRLGKRNAMFAVLGLAIAGGVSKWFIYTPSQPYMLLLDAVLNGPIWVALGVLVPSMMADLCDYDELRYGQRREGIIGAVFTWITKVGLSFTFLFAGVALTLSGFDEKLGVNQPAGTLSLMRALFTLSSVLAPVLGIIALKYYAITEQRAEEIRHELEARRGRV